VTEALKIAKQIISCFQHGGKILICGNGGSAQQANHFAAELIHEGLPAVSLVSDIAVITATANDFSYKDIFARQIIALGKEGDLLISLSTSGTSKNILYAITWAKRLGLEVINFPTNQELNKTTPHTQEIHLEMIHQIWAKLAKWKQEVIGSDN
jgi:D-sedoheptulose 7-phosphate isomerase